MKVKGGQNGKTDHPSAMVEMGVCVDAPHNVNTCQRGGKLENANWEMSIMDEEWNHQKLSEGILADHRC